MLALQTFISILNHKLTLLQSVLKNGEPLPLHYSLIVETHPPAMQSSSRHTLKGSYVGLGEQSLLPRPLDHSSQSLVASSKSLRSSRYSLSSSELQNGKAAFPQLGETSPSGPSPARCVVHCGDMTVPYGYELCIPGEEPMVSLATESCVVSLAIALSRHEIGILNGEHPESKVETTFEMAKVLILTREMHIAVCVVWEDMLLCVWAGEDDLMILELFIHRYSEDIATSFSVRLTAHNMHWSGCLLELCSQDTYYS